MNKVWFRSHVVPHLASIQYNFIITKVYYVIKSYLVPFYEFFAFLKSLWHFDWLQLDGIPRWNNGPGRGAARATCHNWKLHFLIHRVTNINTRVTDSESHRAQILIHSDYLIVTHYILYEATRFEMINYQIFCMNDKDVLNQTVWWKTHVVSITVSDALCKCLWQ